MITLFTGTTGAGKTALIISEIIKIQASDKSRLVYVHGVRSLNQSVVPHIPIYCKSELCEVCVLAKPSPDDFYVENWHEWAEKGSLIFIDEIQRIFRPRAGSKAPPDAIAKLETHRHSGIDFFIATQHPNLVDISVRALTAKHIHITNGWSGRKKWEWSECKASLSRTDAIVSSYKLPKSVFSLYHSADVHTEIKHKKPFFYYMLYALLAFLVIGSYLFYSRLHERTQNVVIESQPKPASSGGVSTAASAAGGASHEHVDVYPDFKPRFPMIPESAPAYDKFTQPVSAPTLAGCIYSKAKGICTCYTSQATTYPATAEQCMAHVRGFVFNPYVSVSSKGYKPEK